MGRIFFPRRCVICDEVLPVRQKYLCNRCYDKPKFVGEDFCLKCGKPVGESEEYCLDCRDKENSFLYGRSALVYDNALRKSLLRLKSGGRQEYARYYGKILYERFSGWINQVAPDVLIPVPLHIKRYRKRGYNQAELIATELGKYCGVPVLTDYLMRGKDTLPQKELSAKERLANLSQAFFLANMDEELSTQLKCVIIIDDIYTTGSTMEACARVLRTGGVEKIYFLCVSTGQGY